MIFAVGPWLAPAGPASMAQMYLADTTEAVLKPGVLVTERPGNLRFVAGMPHEGTVRNAYDNLDFMR